MSNKLLNGSEVSTSIKYKLNKNIEYLKNRGIVPKLAAILVGTDSASKIYVKNKHKTFISMNCASDIYHLDEDTNEKEIINLIEKLNIDVNVHGILIQLPVPKHINSDNLIKSISYEKDVDGLHPTNMGLLMQGRPNFIPCTPYGCLKILEYYKISVAHKNVVIIGRSNLVGKPLQTLLSQKILNGNATVTLCHTGTRDLKSFTVNADIIIVAVGKPDMLSLDMIKNGVVIIDVGINRINDDSVKGYHIVGDVDYKNLLSTASGITPVPGGVGVMTVTMLLHNTVKSAMKLIN
tara:strand:+ start:1175 stop:2053 length:879 start_codon:yes stop_codon:yes gene_type:complete